jgi:DME family drug/metabolite transporter
VLLSPALVVSDVSWVLSARGIAVAIWTAPIATGFSYIFFSHGLRESAVAVAATMTLAEPLTAAVLGLVVLGEPALASTIGGIVAILVGLLVLAREG